MGSHVTHPYSSTGLTKELNSLINVLSCLKKNKTTKLYYCLTVLIFFYSIPVQSTSEMEIPAVQVLKPSVEAILTLKFNPRNNSPMCVVTA